MTEDIKEELEAEEEVKTEAETESDAIKEETEERAEEAPAEEKAEETEDKEEKEDKKGRRDEKKYKSKCAALEKELADTKSALESAKDSQLRIAAEYDNFRKRSQKEKDAIYSDAVSDTVKELLPLFDNLDLASSYTDGEKVGEGLALILKSVPGVLSKLNVEPFGERGEKFDPNLHDAMMHEENEEYGENEIVEVFRKGYKTGDKIIRHALVKVAN